MEGHDEEGGGREGVDVGREGRGGCEFGDLRHLGDGGIKKSSVVVLFQALNTECSGGCPIATTPYVLDNFLFD